MCNVKKSNPNWFIVWDFAQNHRTQLKLFKSLKGKRTLPLTDPPTKESYQMTVDREVH
jgi:hypothetical protein